MPTQARKLRVEILGDSSGAEKAFAETDQAADKFGESIGSRFKAGALVAGAGAAAVAIAGFTEALDREQATANLSASIGLSPEDSAAAGKIAGELYANNFGDSFEAVNDAIGIVVQSGLSSFDAAPGMLEDITAKALTLADVFEVDLGEAAAAIGTMMRTDLVDGAAEGLDLLTASFQKVPVLLRGEILAALNEYTPFFSQLQISGSNAINALTTAAAGGQIAIDKTGDAIKELTIRATDGSKSTIDALSALGLEAEAIAAGFAQPGYTSRVAFEQVLDAILALDDPLAQVRTGVALFGTPFEDLGENAIPVLQSLKDGLGDVEGAADAMVDTVGGTKAAKLESFKRRMETNVTNVMVGAVGAIEKLPGPLQGVVAGIVGFGPVLAPLAPIVGGLIPVLTGTGAAAGVAGAGFTAMLGPIALVVAGVAAAVAAGYLIVRNWDTIKEAAKAVGRFLADLAGEVVDFVQEWGVIALGPVGVIWKFRDEIWGAVKAIGRFLADLVGGVVNFVQEWGWVLGGGIGAAWHFRDEIGRAILGVMEWLASIPGRAVGALGDLAGVLYGAGRALIQGLRDGMIDAATGMLNWVGGLAGNIARLKGPLDYDRRLLTPAGSAIIQGLVAGMQAEEANLVEHLKHISGVIGGFGTGPSAVPAPFGAAALGGTGAGAVTVRLDLGGGVLIVDQASAAALARQLGPSIVTELQREGLRRGASPTSMLSPGV